MLTRLYLAATIPLSNLDNCLSTLDRHFGESVSYRISLSQCSIFTTNPNLYDDIHTIVANYYQPNDYALFHD
jgi:hypothetical protein